MRKEDGDVSYPLLPKTAEHLNNTGDGYRYLIDDSGAEWLVGGVADKGRYIHLFKAGCNGAIEKDLWSHEFGKFRIVPESLSDEQQREIERVLM